MAPSFLDFAPGLAKGFLYPRLGYVAKLPSSVYYRSSVLLPSGTQTSRSLIVCVQCEHWTHTSTELPCGGSLTSYVYAMVLPRGVCLLLSRPSVGGSLIPSPCSMSPLVSLLPWGSRLTPPKVWRPPRPSCQVWLCRISVTLRAGLRRSLLSGSMTLTSIPLLVPPFSCRSCATYIHTRQGLESLAVWAFSFPKRFDTARVPEGERL